MTLRLQFLDGSLTKSTELIGKMENYVSVTVLNDPKFQGRQARTKIVEGAAKTKKEENRIKFNDVLEVPVSSQSARLFVKVMDEDMTSDDTCAEGYVNLAQCGILSGQPGTFRLLTQFPPQKNKPATTGQAGDVRFIAQYFRN